MNIEAKKLELIQQLMLVDDEAILRQYERLLVQAGMQARTEESIHAIENGNVLTINEFRAGNKEWLKKRSTK